MNEPSEEEDAILNDLKDPIPQYKVMNPNAALDEMAKLIEDIKSGKFRLVGFEEQIENEILELHNPGGNKPITKPTGRQIKTLGIRVANMVTE